MACSTVIAVMSFVMLAIGSGSVAPLAASTPGKPTAPIALAPYPGQAGAAASPGSTLVGRDDGVGLAERRQQRHRQVEQRAEREDQAAEHDDAAPTVDLSTRRHRMMVPGAG